MTIEEIFAAMDAAHKATRAKLAAYEKAASGYSVMHLEDSGGWRVVIDEEHSTEWDAWEAAVRLAKRETSP